MNTPKLDVDSLIEALQGDLPSEREEARVRARLIAAGVIATTALTSAEVAASTLSLAGAAANSVGGNVAGAAAGSAASSAAGAAVLGAGASVAPLGAVPIGLAQAGLWSKLIALPLAAKVGIAGTVAVGVAAGSVPALRDVRFVERESATIAAAGRVQEPAARLSPRSAAPAAPAGELQLGLATQSSAAPADDRVVAPVPDAASARAVSRASAVSFAQASRRARGTPSARQERPATSRVDLASGGSAAAAANTAGASSERLALPASGAAPALNEAVARAENTGASTPNAYASASTLAEETGLMERAIAALHAGDLALARYWLSEHERRFPRGLLARERLRALANVERQAR